MKALIWIAALAILPVFALAMAGQKSERHERPRGAVWEKAGLTVVRQEHTQSKTRLVEAPVATSERNVVGQILKSIWAVLPLFVIIYLFVRFVAAVGLGGGRGRSEPSSVAPVAPVEIEPTRPMPDSQPP